MAMEETTEDSTLPIKIYSLYINNNNELNKSDINIVNIKNNFLPKKDLIEILTRFKFFENKHYKLLNILSYNIDLQKDKLNDYVDFLNKKKEVYLNKDSEIIVQDELNNEYNFLKNLPLNDLTFKNPIEKLKTLNGIYLIYYEKYTDASLRNTRKINKFGNHKSKRMKLTK